MHLTEDDIYRSSTQYRLWSYTPEGLQSLRIKTHATASQRVLAAKRRESQSNHNAPNGTATSSDLTTTLTLDEEQQILIHFARQLIVWSRSLFKYPDIVTATAAMYYRRFYLYNSPMTYHPQSIFPTILMLAVKTEHIPGFHVPSFRKKIESFPKNKLRPTDQEIMAPEYLILQGLRFTLQTRHPLKGLLAGWMELDAVARGHEVVIHPAVAKSREELKKDMSELSLPPGVEDFEMENAQERAKTAYDKAHDVLLGAALLTDVYFLYTPAQIWMAAFLTVDEPLMLFYLNIKLGSNSEAATGTGADARVSRIIGTIRACAEMLKSYVPPNKQSADGKAKLTGIDKKLWQCLNPEKRDLVKLSAANKAGDGKVAEVTDSARKRKKGLSEDDVFGPPLKKHESPLKTEIRDEGG